jgi:peptidoglycan/xylan/chitin deacetylase (PgdA/CDA1 family)
MRRRLAAASLLGLAAGGALAAALLPGGGDHRSSRPLALPSVAARPPRRPELTLATLEQREIDRLVRLGLPLYCGGSRGRYVALTFDDGPGPYTRLVLRILDRAGARASFFLVGRNLARADALPREERELGAVGDHSWSHLWLPGLGVAAMDRQLAYAQAAIARASDGPVDLFRPPYGAHDRAIDAEARRLGMLEALWSVDSRDSLGAPWYRIAATVDRDARPGAVILLHENRGQTIRALRFAILPALRRLGLHPVSIPQLLALDPPTLRQLREGLRGCGASLGSIAPRPSTARRRASARRP